MRHSVRVRCHGTAGSAIYFTVCRIFYFNLNGLSPGKRHYGRKREKNHCPPQRVINRSLGMDPGRVKDRDLHIALVDEQRDLGAAEDHALCPFLVHKPVDDPDILFPRLVTDIVPDEFVEDDFVDVIAFGLLGVTTSMPYLFFSASR